MGSAGLSWRFARFACTQSQVPGMTCITPRALAAETIELLKPLSCHAIAEASDAGTPLRVATMAMSEEVTRPEVGWGAAAGAVVAAGEGADASGAPVGSFSAVPEISHAVGEMPFIAATAAVDTPLLAASALSESPGRTV